VEKYKFKSTAASVQNFIESYIWRDMKSLLLDMLEEIRSELETTDDSKTIYRLQGEAAEIRKFMALPEALLDIIDRDNKQED